jgi:hypothetical protein
LLLLPQALPPTQENGEGVPIAIKGTIARCEGEQQSNEATMGAESMYLKNKKVNNKV